MMKHITNRRDFVKTVACGTGALLTPGWLRAAHAADIPTPSYLKGYETLYAQDPRAAGMQWFREAKLGLFIHYGLYSLLGRGEWVMENEKIPVTEYAMLKERFTAEKFDADFITDLALAAEMKYVNITTRHPDDSTTLREVGRRLRANGFPKGSEPVIESQAKQPKSQ